MRKHPDLQPLLSTLALIFALTLAPPTAAELRRPAVFGDHMVLQRDQPLPVWGWADPGAEVTVEFLGQTAHTSADADGKWQVAAKRLRVLVHPRQD
ncbi:MAG: hypothetical protein VX293_12700 [Candidatus Latescibacterota bacterium]|nr:hypothetical protein [Candidatus Latescibacterota bacterium]